ncbi:MAG: phosphatidylserine decarboxylase [Bacteroidia bacterium]|nr:MAG: phosphatidylserine decarboxylase [Bacteroidia bacterium]
MEIRYIERETGEIRTETPPAESLLRFLYDNPCGKTTILPIVKRKFISEIYGRRMNTPASAKKISAFVNEMGIDMSESEKEIAEFCSFNDFFVRKLKPEARQIQKGFVSPGDGRLIAFDRLCDLQSFFVKGQEFTLAAFLKNRTLAEKYSNSSLFILRLAPNDYHRFHFPYAGVPSPAKKIKGFYCSVSPYAIAENFAKVFCENKREYTILDTKDKGEVLIAPIGATMVGSIVETYQANLAVKKGTEMGYFAFGGSTILMLVKQQNIKIDEDILQNTKNRMETFVKMGEKIAR